MGYDIGKIISKVQEYVDKLNSVLPTHWKGNDAPLPHHWDAGSIKASADLDVPGLKASFGFDFTDGGVAHRIDAVLPLNQDTLKTWAAQIVLDGVEQSDPRIALGGRVGLEGLTLYDRIVVEMKFTGTDGTAHDYRFDGDLP